MRRLFIVLTLMMVLGYAATGCEKAEPPAAAPSVGAPTTPQLAPAAEEGAPTTPEEAPAAEEGSPTKPEEGAPAQPEGATST